jgi:hypothetical protein
MVYCKIISEHTDKIITSPEKADFSLENKITSLLLMYQDNIISFKFVTYLKQENGIW